MDNNERNQIKASTAAKREKKAARRDDKAARKAANKVEEKKSRPNNVLLAILIFGVIIGMFAFIKGYEYYSKEASIETYLANNGGEDTYGSMAIDSVTTAKITAEKNSMKIDMTSTIEDEDAAKEYADSYKEEDGEKQLKYIAAYFLTTIKPEVRGFSADCTVTEKVNDEEAGSVEMTYSEAKKFLKDLEKEAQEEAAQEDDGTSDDAAADTAADTSEDEDSADGAADAASEDDSSEDESDGE